MTRPLKQDGSGQLAEFLDADRMPVTALPLDVARATESAQLRALADEAGRYVTRRGERSVRVDLRGSIGVRGLVR